LTRLIKIQVEVLIIGGGVMGLSLARRYGAMGSERERPYQVLCLRMSDKDVPKAETLRNQGWLQSGARYYWSSDERRKSKHQARDQARSSSDESELRRAEEALQREQVNCDKALEMHYAAKEIRKFFGRSRASALGSLGIICSPDGGATEEQRSGLERCSV